MNEFKRIAFIGCGLIGGSLAMIWRNADPSRVLVGYDRPDVLHRALETGILDEAAGSAEDAVREADLVVIAAPVGTIPQLIGRIAPHLKTGAVVTDVGSVKTPVVLEAQRVLPETSFFVGGHPMAGSEKAGVEHADSFLFENATYVLCPPAGMTAEEFAGRFSPLISLVEETGARILILEAERHDRIAAAVSHVPQLLAVMLMNLAAELNDRDDAFLRLAAGGFRDMTRIASSPFHMWRDILAANRAPVHEMLSRFEQILEEEMQHLAGGDLAPLQSRFESARTVRDTIPKNTKGFLHPLSDVYVFAEDRPGFLLQITKILYEADLNIKDIELLKIREGTGGAFRIGFGTEADADSAVSALRDAGYKTDRL